MGSKDTTCHTAPTNEPGGATASSALTSGVSNLIPPIHGLPVTLWGWRTSRPYFSMSGMPAYCGFRSRSGLHEVNWISWLYPMSVQLLMSGHRNRQSAVVSQRSVASEGYVRRWSGDRHHVIHTRHLVHQRNEFEPPHSARPRPHHGVQVCRQSRYDGSLYVTRDVASLGLHSSRDGYCGDRGIYYMNCEIGKCCCFELGEQSTLLAGSVRSTVAIHSNGDVSGNRPWSAPCPGPVVDGEGSLEGGIFKYEAGEVGRQNQSVREASEARNGSRKVICIIFRIFSVR